MMMMSSFRLNACNLLSAGRWIQTEWPRCTRNSLAIVSQVNSFDLVNSAAMAVAPPLNPAEGARASGARVSLIKVCN